MKSISLKDKAFYTNEEYDITIIELKEKEIDICEFLELDDNVFFEDIDNIGLNYIGKSIYILHYPSNYEEDKAAVSYGIIKKGFEDKIYNFIHYSCTEFGSSGSPILNLSNNKIMEFIKKEEIKILIQAYFILCNNGSKEKYYSYTQIKIINPNLKRKS